MPRTIIAETVMQRDTFFDVTSPAAFQAFDNTNGMYLSGSGSNRKSGAMVLDFKNTNAATRTVTIKAGSGGDTGPAWRAGLGDLVVTLGANTGNQKIYLQDTARFKQADGTINIDGSGSNVTVAAYRLVGF